jgi:protein-S-isoprenylcysteine O-methyltransferase Ste14
MESVAYYIALVMVLAIPAVMPCWLLIHPFVKQWRKVGPFATYLVMSGVVFMLMVGIYRIRKPLLRIHFGVRMPLVILAAFLFGVAMYVGIRRIHRLSLPVMLGLPEISRRKGPGKLVTGGIYSQMRHPRYVEIGLVIVAAALFSNYLAAYLLLVFYSALTYLVVLLEERELKSRFGAAYEQYCKEVPRFVPRLRRASRVRVND